MRDTGIWSAAPGGVAFQRPWASLHLWDANGRQDSEANQRKFLSSGRPSSPAAAPQAAQAPSRQLPLTESHRGPRSLLTLPGSGESGASLGASVRAQRQQPGVAASVCPAGPSLLTVLQCGHRLRLCAEVTVPDVIGGLQAQLIGGEGPQPGWTRRRAVTAGRPPGDPRPPPGALGKSACPGACSSK